MNTAAASFDQAFLDAIDAADLGWLSEIETPTVLAPLARCAVPGCSKLVSDDEWDTAWPMCGRHGAYRDDRMYLAAMRSYDFTLRSLGIEPHPDPKGAARVDDGKLERAERSAGRRR